MDMNIVVITGNLVADPEMSVLQSGDKKLSFRIAVNRRGKEEKTDFFHVNAWARLAETCEQFLKKGSRVAIRGSLQMRTFNTKDGATRTIVEINADDVMFLYGKKEQGDNAAPARYAQSKMDGMPPVAPMDEDDLPF